MIVAWPLIVGVALFGWGLASATVVKRWSGVDLRDPADALPLGVAVYLSVAGIAVALDVHTPAFTTIMIVAGLSAAAVALVARSRVAPVRWWADLGLASSLIGLLLIIAVWHAAQFFWTACDDDAAYLYLARRLAGVGDLLDPLNNRRLTSLGGMSSLQALLLGRLGDAALPLADLFLGTSLVIVQLWRTARGRWSIAGIAAGIALALCTGNLGIANTSPVLLPLGLALAAYRFAWRARAADRDGSTRGVARDRLLLGAALGIVVAAAGALRPQFALGLGIFAGAALLLPPIRRSTLLHLAGLAGGLVIGLGGWAAAAWRAVGTPLFPLMGGNLDPAWPANGPDIPGPSAADLVDNLLDVLASPTVGLAVLLGSVVLIGVRVAEGDAHPPTSTRWSGRTYILAIGANALLLAILGVMWWNVGELLLFPRFWMPLVIASVLLPLAVVNASALVGTRAVALEVGAFAAVAVVLTVGAVPQPGLKDLVADTTSGRSLSALSADRYSQVRSEYDEVSRMIAPGSKVLTAVDVPSLLLDRGFEAHTLDLVGSTSPRPRLPYFIGSTAKVAWARNEGYDYIVATDPAVAVCPLFNAGRQEKLLAAGGLYGSWAPWYLDWFESLDQLGDSPPTAGVSTTRVGSLIIVEV